MIPKINNFSLFPRVNILEIVFNSPCIFFILHFLYLHFLYLIWQNLFEITVLIQLPDHPSQLYVHNTRSLHMAFLLLVSLHFTYFIWLYILIHGYFNYPPLWIRILVLIHTARYSKNFQTFEYFFNDMVLPYPILLLIDMYISLFPGFITSYILYMPYSFLNLYICYSIHYKHAIIFFHLFAYVNIVSVPSLIRVCSSKLSLTPQTKTDIWPS